MSIKLPPEAAKSLGIALPDGVKPPRGRGRGPKFVRPDPPPIGSRVLALDVSSTATGTAVVEMTAKGPHLVCYGLHKPPADLPATERTSRMIDLIVSAPFDVLGIGVVVMEMTDGTTWGGKRRTSHLVQLAIAQGRVYEYLRDSTVILGPPETVSAAQWTGGVPKAERAERVRMIFPELRDIRDPGLDVHDAAGIGLWRLGL